MIHAIGAVSNDNTGGGGIATISISPASGSQGSVHSVSFTITTTNCAKIRLHLDGNPWVIEPTPWSGSATILHGPPGSTFYADGLNASNNVLVSTSRNWWWQ